MIAMSGLLGLAVESQRGDLRTDVVVTRYREKVDWLEPYLSRPGWSFFVYTTGQRHPSSICVTAGVSCHLIPNAGYEWHGYLRHMIDRYEQLAERTIFLQGDPFTVSPDLHCLFNQTRLFAPVQVLSWVQMAKRKMPLFSGCGVSNVGRCRVWIEPITAGMRPMLHGDRWLHKACRMAKRFKGVLFQFLVSQLAGEPELASGPAAQHVGLIRAQQVPAQLYRSYGSQMSIERAVLRERPRSFYERLLKWLVTPNDDMAKVRPPGAISSAVATAARRCPHRCGWAVHRRGS